MYKLILPIRYLLRRRISFLAVAAVALCVFIVVVVMTVMNGLVSDFKNKNHDFAGDCVIATDSLVGFAYYDKFMSELQKQDFVLAASAVVKGFGLLNQNGSQRSMGVELMGIDPAAHSRATGFGKTLYYHKDNPEKAFEVADEPDAVGCVVGIIKVFGPTDSSGQYHHSPKPLRINLTISTFPLTVKGALAKAGSDLVNTRTFYYSDDSHSGIVKVDNLMVYIPFDYAQKLCGMAGTHPRASAIHVKFTDGTGLQNAVESVRNLWRKFVKDHSNEKYAHLLENVSVQSWLDYRRSSIAPMEKEQTMLIFLFLMLAVITVFVVFVVFYMIISHKSKDIGILKSIGVSNANVVILFMTFAAFVGAIGSALGTAGGCAFLTKINNMEDWLFDRFGWQLWDRSVYAIGDIPNNIDFGILAVIILSAMAASLTGALLPTVQSAGRKPAEILQVNQL